MKIVIAGAGYGGLVAANTLARKGKNVRVTVVSPTDEFVERVRLHEMIAGSRTAARPLSEVLHPAITHVRGAVTTVGRSQVSLSDGTTLDFDRLIYAIGNSDAAPGGTLAVGSVADAREAATQVAALAPGATVTVVGGGLTGIEVASEIATKRPELSVRLISDEVGSSLSDSARQRVQSVLAVQGVDVVAGRWAADDRADLTLWAVAAEVNAALAGSGLATDGAGRIAVDAYLRSVSNPAVWAIGDCASVPNSRPSCAAALPQGTYAAKTILRQAQGKPLEPFRMSFLAQNVSLGRHDAVIQHVRGDDSPTHFYVGGRAAAFLKEQVCRFAARSAANGDAFYVKGKR